MEDGGVEMLSPEEAANLRSQRVEALRDLIERGQYSVEPELVAARLMAEMVVWKDRDLSRG